MFQQIGAAWIDGIYQYRVGTPFYGYPPFATVLFATLTPLSETALRATWLCLNIAATVLIIRLLFLLYDRRWSFKVCSFALASLLCWSSLRATYAIGQLGLMIVALLLAALYYGKTRKLLAGILLGLALTKYTLCFPFVLYFLWRREWKIVLSAWCVPALLTCVFAWRFGLSPVTVIYDYFSQAAAYTVGSQTYFSGATDIKPLVLLLSRDHFALSALLMMLLWASGLFAMIYVFRLRPRAANAHYAVLSLFALWSVYHRTHDSVLFILPFALLIDYFAATQSDRHARFGKLWLTISLPLLALNVPHQLFVRLAAAHTHIFENPLVQMALHVDRAFVFALFWFLLLDLWKTRTIEDSHQSIDKRAVASV